VPIIKVVPNALIYLQKNFQIFLTFLAFSNLNTILCFGKGIKEKPGLFNSLPGPPHHCCLAPHAVPGPPVSTACVPSLCVTDYRASHCLPLTPAWPIRQATVTNPPPRPAHKLTRSPIHTVPDKPLPGWTSCLFMSHLSHAPFGASSPTLTPPPCHPIGHRCSMLRTPEQKRCKGQNYHPDTTSPRCHPLTARPNCNAHSPICYHCGVTSSHAPIVPNGPGPDSPIPCAYKEAGPLV
jgi:hypothetical protein